MKLKNKIEIAGPVGLLYMPCGALVLFDAEEADRVAVKRWFLSDSGYATHTFHSGGKTEHLYLHRFLRPSLGLIDHWNTDTLDCRKNNLRPATKVQNNQHRRGWKSKGEHFKGVFWEERTQRWRAGIGVGTKKHWLGRFICPKEAAAAYNAAALRFFGQFALCNPV